MFIKDKNVHAAESLVAKINMSELKELTMEQLAALAVEAATTEKDLKAQAALVKKHVNEIYAPMCAKKKELEIKYAFLNAKLEKAKEVNPAAIAMAKLFGG